ncbi:hypothetical protein Agabi119p4_1159 [Agaricus bisporus var. burnettii]|uniref:CBF1-interacting co-repressor CIR N-terminal domain-containing protein n=1 Tax=Agaricus bisporus var. burnettii TaxID=192524 RepID=A0A8H7FC21_AGABI|nr:hypothetical protein Agabi119p4_1159 [Agaricus bisporus var. burnettii]
MGGGDLNMKKSWHPLLLKNQERVWLEEKKALEEKKKLDQLRKEKEEERQLQELQRLQEEQTGKKRQEKLEWMYSTPATGNSQNPNDLEDYLLGKKRVDKMLTADENAKLGASHRNFIAVQNANTVRDISAKIREDPLLAIKQQEQAAYQALLANPLRLWAMQERNGIKPEKDKKERKREKEERKRLKAERKYRRERSSRSLSPHERRRSRSRSPYESRRSPSPYSRRSRSRDRDYYRPPPYNDRRDRPSRQYSPEPRRAGNSRNIERDDRGRDRARNHGSSSSAYHRSRSPQYANGRRERNSSPAFRPPRHHSDPIPPLRSRTPPRQASTAEKDTKTSAEERAARLAAMTSNASSMQDERKKRLAELLEQEKAELAREEEQRAKSAKSGGVGKFMSADYKKVYSGEGGLEDRLRRARGTLVVDYLVLFNFHSVNSLFSSTLAMPPRRAPSVPSVVSRAPSPVFEEDDTPFFDSVDELQQHARH